MKKQYEAPMAEKLDFNYLENVVASDPISEPTSEDQNLKGQTRAGMGGANGCYKGNKNAETYCTPMYG